MFWNGQSRILNANFRNPSFRNLSTATPVKTTEGLKLLVTAGPNAQEAVGLWLFVSAAWVYSMVVLGGITRLTSSGLPMTDWKFSSRIPLSNDDWLIEFEKYKQSHEYKRMNKEMNLDDFKLMYWMEYAHILWFRSLGVMLGVPFSYFLSKRYITLRLGLRLSGLFALVAGQGLVGWLTTKSGSEEPKSEFAEPRVSFYRLAAHLTSTFVVYSGLFSTALSVAMPESPAESVAWVQQAAKVKRLVLPVSFIVGITAISGAFVAENGRAFSDSPSPTTSDGWVSEDMFVLKTQIQNFFDNIPTPQLVHQILTAASLFCVGGLWWSMKKLDMPPALRTLIGSTTSIAVVQVFMGTAPLFSVVPASLGTLNQAGALTLLTLAIYLNHIVRQPSALLRTLSFASKRA
ncbi:cytochrome c oxidase 15 [Perilla frutescens var. frutescens]|nr:cytochrome c oxidase 15 [Perilla frutescens var. frutescens]